ncbi:helix-hairpin-helix domain-containing protein [Fimbriimonas ginsengisoli]|uniref:DNA-dependent DNA polymerase family X protein n=1 Tax=Fimbriimonas ginsengisoli Gsoil 348 TaxID=661478 RepID=A0A068NSL1_FIMGI|nr:helix-hairpin-helix domain-containing protein [Fimbriimonas ginsengisoli]AIE86347.1 DNA-dependent DNA polymerase family X protein [Fimbriimonas ginsengisoli Gsoil 348]
MTNAELAQKLKDLRDFLIIAGYEESHATRYSHIARTIEKMPEQVEDMRREGRLQEIPQVGSLIALYIKEILETGTSSKQKEWEPFAPISVLELVRIPGLGPKTAATMYHAHGIDSLKTLREAQENGILDDIPGVGPKLRETIREYLAERP